MYVRREKSGISTVVPDEGEYKNLIHFLNPTGTIIFEMYNNGKHSINEIARELKRKYPKQNLNSLINDVENYLFALSHLGIIKWIKKEGYDMEKKNKSLIFRPLDERDIYELSEILSKKFKQYHEGKHQGIYYTLNDKVEKFSPFAIRMRHFHFMESFFLMLKQEKIIGAIGILQLTPAKKSVDLGTVIIPDDGETYQKDTLKFIKYIINKLKELKMVKLKCNIPRQKGKDIAQNICDSSFLEFLNRTKFSLEAILANELGRNMDLVVFSREI